MSKKNEYNHGASNNDHDELKRLKEERGLMLEYMEVSKKNKSKKKFPTNKVPIYY